jgi:hypothetical protein
MTMTAEEIRGISVAYYETPEPDAEEIVEAVVLAAQAVARLGRWHTTYTGSGFIFLDKHDKLSTTQLAIVERLASLGYSPRVESRGEGLKISW